MDGWVEGGWMDGRSCGCSNTSVIAYQLLNCLSKHTHIKRDHPRRSLPFIKRHRAALACRGRRAQKTD